MITREELNPHNYILTAEQEKNQEILFIAINIIRKAYNKAMSVSSGVRSSADQQRINPSAPKSKHLIGAAVDIADVDHSLYIWCKANPSILEKANLWCEEGTRTWVHFQCLPFASYRPGGSRWFFP